MKLVCLIFFVALSSCSKKVNLNQKSVSPLLTEVSWNFSSVTEGTWAVGMLYRNVVSKNLTVVVKLPEFRNSDMEFLLKNFKVDSWLIKVIHKQPSGALSELITLYAPFRSVIQGRPGEPVRSIAFSLTYAAWAMSERFRRFQCPAFAHDLRLDDFEAIDQDKPLSYSVSAFTKVDVKVVPVELVPPKLNIGQSMRGEYYLEAALYNSSEKMLYSPYQRLPLVIRVSKEVPVKVDGCAGVRQEFEKPYPN